MGGWVGYLTIGEGPSEEGVRSAPVAALPHTGSVAMATEGDLVALLREC